MPGVVFSGSLDGHFRAYDSGNGKVLLDVNTINEYDTVNDVPARGGSINGPGATVARRDMPAAIPLAMQASARLPFSDRAFETVFSPAGRNVYASNQTPGGVAMLTRAPNGSLSQVAGTAGGCVTTGGTSGGAGGTECVAASPTLTQAWAANLDRQGAFVFVSAAGGNTVFRRDQTNGRLSQTDCVYEVGTPAPVGVCHEVKGAAGSDAAVSPDGNHVVLNASGLGLSFLTLNRTTGRLAQRAKRGCFAASPAPPCQNVPGLLGGLGSVALSPNGLYVFAAVRVPPANGGSIVSF